MRPTWQVIWCPCRESLVMGVGRRRRDRVLAAGAILVGLAGLAFAGFGPRGGAQVSDRRLVHQPDYAAEEIRGARLDAAPSEPPAVPYGTSPPIPESSFAAAARVDGVATRREGRLVFERTEDGQFLRVSMSALSSFPYQPRSISAGARELGIPSPPPDIPDEILALDGVDAVLVGFMVPLDVDSQGVAAFVLSQNRSFCCYGITPAMNEMVVVQMEPGARAPFIKDMPIAVYGALSVSELREGDEVVSLYRLKGSAVTSLVAFGSR